MNSIDPKLLEQIACPACESRPRLKQTPEGLYCAKCERIYPIASGGIPILLIDEAVQKSPAQNPKE